MSSKKRPKYCEEIVLYLDWNIGKYDVPAILRKNGIACEVHADYLPQDAVDEEWVRLCSEKNWLGITLDNRLQHNAKVKEVVRENPVAIFSITSASMKGEELGELLVKSYVKMRNFTSANKKPFLATLSRGGYVTKKIFP